MLNTACRPRAVGDNNVRSCVRDVTLTVQSRERNALHISVAVKRDGSASTVLDKHLLDAGATVGSDNVGRRAKHHAACCNFAARLTVNVQIPGDKELIIIGTRHSGGMSDEPTAIESQSSDPIFVQMVDTSVAQIDANASHNTFHSGGVVVVQQRIRHLKRAGEGRSSIRKTERIRGGAKVDRESPAPTEHIVNFRITVLVERERCAVTDGETATSVKPTDSLSFILAKDDGTAVINRKKRSRTETVRYDADRRPALHSRCNVIVILTCDREIDVAARFSRRKSERAGTRICYGSGQIHIAATRKNQVAQNVDRRQLSADLHTVAAVRRLQLSRYVPSGFGNRNGFTVFPLRVVQRQAAKFSRIRNRKRTAPVDASVGRDQILKMRALIVIDERQILLNGNTLKSNVRVGLKRERTAHGKRRIVRANDKRNSIKFCT